MRTQSPLFAAIDRDDAMAVRALVVAQPDLVRSRDETDAYRPYPLHAAARLGRTVILKVLLGAGADVQALNKRATTALGIACVYGHVGIARELVLAGADVNACNEFGFTPLSAAIAGAQGQWTHYASAALADWAEIVAILTSAKVPVR